MSSSRGSSKPWWQKGYKNPGPETLGAHPAAKATEDGSNGLTSPPTGGATPRGKVQAAFAPDRYRDFLGRDGRKRTKRRRVGVGDVFRPTSMVGGPDTPSPPRPGPDRQLRRLPSATSLASVTSLASTGSAESDLTQASVGAGAGRAGAGAGAGRAGAKRRTIYVKPFVVRSAKGFRNYNEDRYVAYMSLEDEPPHSFFAVFDGHGGRRAAEYCTNHLYKNLVRDGSWPEQPIDALKSAVLKTDSEFRTMARASKDEGQMLDGSTAICVLVMGSHVFVTNVGDSRAVLVRASGSVVAMSTDHKPTTLAESVRIHKVGGHVADGRVNGVLSVSRSIGDEKLSHLVTAKPDIRPFNLKHPDDLIVLASDGLWDVMQNEDVLKTVHGSNMTTSAERLIAEAVLRGSKDNITVMIVHVGNASGGVVKVPPPKSPFMPPPARRANAPAALRVPGASGPVDVGKMSSPALGRFLPTPSPLIAGDPRFFGTSGGFGAFRDDASMDTDSSISPSTPMTPITPGTQWGVTSPVRATGTGSGKDSGKDSGKSEGGGSGTTSQPVPGPFGATPAGAGATPFGAVQAPSAQNPFGASTAVPPSSNPFGATAATPANADPFGAGAASNPFGAGGAAASNPFGAVQSTGSGGGNPFAAQSKPSNPFESARQPTPPTKIKRGKSDVPRTANSFVSLFAGITPATLSQRHANAASSASGAGSGGGSGAHAKAGGASRKRRLAVTAPHKAGSVLPLASPVDVSIAPAWRAALKAPVVKPRVVKKRKFRRRLTVLVANSRAADEESPTQGARPGLMNMSVSSTPTSLPPSGLPSARTRASGSSSMSLTSQASDSASVRSEAPSGARDAAAADARDSGERVGAPASAPQPPSAAPPGGDGAAPPALPARRPLEAVPEVPSSAGTSAGADDDVDVTGIDNGDDGDGGKSPGGDAGADPASAASARS